MTYADVLELSRRQARRDTANPMTGPACVLAYLGGAPLLAASLAMIASPARYSASAQDFLVLYGAALLIFFGGVRWGVAVMKPSGPTMRALLGAALPLVAALPLFAMSGDPTMKIAIIMMLMIALLVDDLRATGRGDGAPEWYLGVRVPLTVLIEVAFLVALAAGVRG